MAFLFWSKISINQTCLRFENYLKTSQSTLWSVWTMPLVFGKCVDWVTRGTGGDRHGKSPCVCLGWGGRSCPPALLPRQDNAPADDGDSLLNDNLKSWIISCSSLNNSLGCRGAPTIYTDRGSTSALWHCQQEGNSPKNQVMLCGRRVKRQLRLPFPPG